MDGLGDLFDERRKPLFKHHDGSTNHDAGGTKHYKIAIDLLPSVIGILGWQVFVLFQSQHLQGFDHHPLHIIFIH